MIIPLYLSSNAKNEAEPLVIYGALENNIIVFAYDNGCISNVLA